MQSTNLKLAGTVEPPRTGKLVKERILPPSTQDLTHFFCLHELGHKSPFYIGKPSRRTSDRTIQELRVPRELQKGVSLLYGMNSTRVCRIGIKGRESAPHVLGLWSLVGYILAIRSRVRGHNPSGQQKYCRATIAGPTSVSDFTEIVIGLSEMQFRRFLYQYQCLRELSAVVQDP